MGPRDLSQALGVPGDFDAPVYQEAVERVSAAAADQGIAAGILVKDRAGCRSLRSTGIRAPRRRLGFQLPHGGRSPSRRRGRLMAAETPRYSAPAAGCAADVMLALAREGAATLLELAGRTGATRSLLYRVLTELELRQCVARATDGRYSLGVATIELGGAYARAVPFMESVRRVLRELAFAAGETASLATLRGGDVLYLIREEGERSVFAVSAPGKLLPANATAIGKALLARRSDAAVAERLSSHGPGELPRLTDRTIVTVDELLVDLARTRQRGWALEEGEAVRGRCCVAVAVTCAACGTRRPGRRALDGANPAERRRARTGPAGRRERRPHRARSAGAGRRPCGADGPRSTDD